MAQAQNQEVFLVFKTPCLRIWSLWLKCRKEQAHLLDYTELDIIVNRLVWFSIISAISRQTSMQIENFYQMIALTIIFRTLTERRQCCLMSNCACGREGAYYAHTFINLKNVIMLTNQILSLMRNSPKSKALPPLLGLTDKHEKVFSLTNII